MLRINSGGGGSSADGVTDVEHGRRILRGEATWFDDRQQKPLRGSDAWYEDPDVKYSDKVMEFSRGKTWDDFK